MKKKTTAKKYGTLKGKTEAPKPEAKQTVKPDPLKEMKEKVDTAMSHPRWMLAVWWIDQNGKLQLYRKKNNWHNGDDVFAVNLLGMDLNRVTIPKSP